MTSPLTLARRSRGFTLIELMVVVAIIGILASIAMPELSRMTYRAKLAERAIIMDRIKKGVADLYLRDGRLTDGLTGSFNPPLPPGNTKRAPDWRMAGWNQILAGMGDIDGALYFSYYFWVSESSNPPLLFVQAVGDLDGDGNQSTKWTFFQRVLGSYSVWSEWPPEGTDDMGVF